MVERSVRNAEVRGSTPLASTAPSGVTGWSRDAAIPFFVSGLRQAPAGALRPVPGRRAA